jgi:transcriptional regulator with XRE-family HTH domain
MQDAIKMQGQRLKAARRYRRKSQMDLANELGTAQSNISFLESNRHTCEPELLTALAKSLDVTEAWLRGESMEGGIPIDAPTSIKESERENITRRFIDAYNRLRTLGLIETDKWFSDFANIPPSTLSLALAGKGLVQYEWVPFLEELGANRDYIYNNHLPIIKLNKAKRISDGDDISKNIMILVQTIEEDMKLLKSYINQLI